MEQENILRTVAAYAIKHADTLRGRLGRQAFYTVRGATEDDRGSRGESRTVYGEPLDVLAETMERDEFFGWWCGSVDASGNAALAPVEPGLTYRVSGIISERDGEQVFSPNVVEPREYLAPIRTPEGLRSYALAERIGSEKVDAIMRETADSIDALFE